MRELTLQEKFQHEFLDVDPRTAEIVNPFANRTRRDIEEPHFHLLRVMRDPKYAYFTCKSLMNGPGGKPLELFPFQAAIIRELWYRPLPMLIANRGGGKSYLLGVYALLRATFIQGRKVVIVGSGFRQAKGVFQVAETIWHNSPVLQSLFSDSPQSGPKHDSDRWVLRIGDSTITALPLGDGRAIRGERAHDLLTDEFACLAAGTLVDTPDGLRRIEDTIGERDLHVHDGSGDVSPVERFVRTPPTTAYRVRTVGNYEFVCSGIHRIGTDSGWKVAKDLRKGDLLEMPQPPPFPERYIDGVDVNMGWLLGILVAEGCVSDRSAMVVHMTDPDCVERTRLAMIACDGTLNPSVYHKDAYEDGRGWTCKESWRCHVSRSEFRNRFAEIGLARTTAHGKSIPWSILQSPRPVVIAFLSALFEGDGSAFLWTDGKVENRFGVAFYSVSEQLCREVQVVLRKLGYFCTRQRRRSNLSENWQWMLRLNGGHALRLAGELDIPKWRPILGAADRIHTRDGDDGVVWDKSRSKWKATSHIRGRKTYLGRFATEGEAQGAVALVQESESDYIRVSSVEELPGDQVLYDYYVPPDHSFLGNGFRQHNSIPWEIYETAVKPFTAVEMDPMGAAMRRAEIRVLRREGVWTEEMAEHERSSRLANQSVIAGTAYYQFNHFFDYWKRWKTIVESQGDRRRLEEAFTSGVAANIDHRDYSIIRIPYGLLPEGFLSETIINDAAATYNTSVFLNEYQSVFASDSNGFFRRSLIESCVTKEPISPVTSPGEFVRFQAATRGSPDGHYMYGIDPASEADRFSIVILEVHPTHRRIVYCWTTTRQQHKQRVQAKATKVEDFYGFCARKIRELMRVFPCEHIALDSQGGGVAVAEALHDPDKMEDGEQPLWTISADHPLSDGKERDTDVNAGLHIIEMVHFARAEWVADANHGMRKDFEDRVLLFPDYDTGVLAIAMEDDQRARRVFDTLEDAVAEVEEIKEELATIVHTQTGSTLRDHWDTPEVKLSGSRKGRLRKDRYSALLMANSSARRLNRKRTEPDLLPLGGFVQHSTYAPQPSQSGKMYLSMPDWFESGLKDERDSFGWAVNRHGVED
jgi:hypothetical protein